MKRIMEMKSALSIKDGIIKAIIGDKELTLTIEEFHQLSQLVARASESNIGAAYIDMAGLTHILNKKEE